MKNFLQVNRALAAKKNITDVISASLGAEKNFTKLGSKLQANQSQMARNLHVIERRFSSTNRLLGSRSERSLTSEEASIQHPLSIHSASIEHPLGVGGNQVATRSLSRIWKYAAMMALLLTLGIGQMWGTDFTQGEIKRGKTASNITVSTTGYTNTNNKQICTSGSNIKDSAVVIASSGFITSGPTYYYVEIKAATGYKLSSLGLKISSNSSSAQNLAILCYKGDSTAGAKPDSVYTMAVKANNTAYCDSITKVKLAVGTKMVRISRQVYINNTTKLPQTSSTGATSYGASSATNLFSLSATAEAEAAANTYTLHTGSSEDATLKTTNTRTNFSKVGSTNEWQITGYTIPSDTKWFVGCNGYFYNDALGSNNSRSSIQTWGGEMYLANSMDEEDASGSPKVGQATGATGTIRIYDNSNWNNLYAGFIPDGYKLKIGSTEKSFSVHDGHEYRSELVELGSSNARDLISAGVINSSGEYVATANSEGMQHLFLQVSSDWAGSSAKFSIYDIGAKAFKSGFMVAVPGETNLYEGWVDGSCTEVIFVRHNSTATSPSFDSGNKWNQTGNLELQSGKNLFTINNGTWDGQTEGWSAYERKGKFRLNDNFKDKNWYVRFYPYYALEYDANGGSGAPATQSVAIDGNAAARTVAVAAGTGMTAPTGYEFYGWNPSESSADARTKDGDYDPSDNVTLSADVKLYAVWTPILVSGISLSPTSANMTVGGGTQTITATVSPSNALDKTIDWSSSNKDVATVSSSGVVTAVAPGSATITATAHDGSGITQTCTITVKATVTYNGNTNTSGSAPTDGSSPYVKDARVVVKDQGTLVKTGYTFVGWNTEDDGSGTYYSPGANFVITENTTLYAQWRDASGTTCPDEEGGTVFSLSMNKKDTGNDTLSMGESKYLSSYATITNGAASFTDTRTSSVKESAIIKSGNPGQLYLVNNGNAAIVLYLDCALDEGDEISFTASQSQELCITTAPPRATTIYTTSKSYTIPALSGLIGAKTIYLWRKDGNVGPETITITRPADCTDPSASLSDESYTIGGPSLDLRTLWSSSNTTDGVTFSITSGTGTIAGDGYTFSSSTTGSVTITASQTSTGDYCEAEETATITVSNPTYNVTYNTTGSDSGSAPSDATDYEEGDKAVVKDNTGTLVKAGKVFCGWNTASTLDGTFYSPTDTIVIATADVNLYPVFGDTIQWTLTLTADATTLTTGAARSSSANISGIGNLLWTGVAYKSSKAGSTTYSCGMTSYSDKAAAAGNHVSGHFTMAAGYSFTPLRVSLATTAISKAKNMSVMIGTDTVVWAQPKSGSSAPTRHEYTFTSPSSYTGKDSLKFVSYGETSGFRIGSPIILYGIVDKASGYTISYDCDEADSGCPDEATDQATLPNPLPSAPTKEGYTFIGWFTNSTKTEAAVAGATLSGDVTLYAKWGTSRTVAWYVDGDEYSTGSPTTTTCEELGITTMPTAPANDYIGDCADAFVGWSTTNLEGDATDTPPTVLFTNAAGAPSIDGNKTFYAVFATSPTGIAANTTLWAETWTGATTGSGNTPSGYGQSGTTVYNSGSVTYTQADDGTYIINNSNAGGTAPELLLKQNTTWTISNIPTGGAEKLSLTYKCNNAYSSVTCSTEGTSISGSPTNYIITTGGAETIELVFKCSNSGNTRLDDIELKTAYRNYRCICPSVTVTPKLVTAGTPIFITSAASKTVRSQDSLVIVGSGLAKNATLSISSPASKFALKSGKNGALTTDATGSIDTVAYIYYTPDAEDTSDGLDKNNSFTISDGINSETVSTALIGRHLPANFVIAAKNGDNWYALPAGMGQGDAAGTRAPVQITVDDDDDPTIASTSDANVYSLIDVPEAVQNRDSGDYVILWMHGKDKPLYGNRTTAPIGSSTKSVINNLDKDYWWALTQKNTSITNAADAKYNISVANGNTNNPLKIWLNAGGTGVPYWGLYSSASNIITEIRLIPWTCANPAAPTISGEDEYTAGETITLTASHDGSNHDAMTTYTWYKGADWATASVASPVQAAATGSSGYTLTIASCTTDDAGTYWCEASNGTCSAHNSSGYAITVSEASCTPQTVSKVVVTGSSAGTTYGYNEKEYVGTPVINVSGKTSDATNIDGVTGNETGYKMSSDGSSIVFATLAKGTFQEGDVVKIGITRRNDTRVISSNKNVLTIYYGTNKDDADSLTTISTGSTTTSGASDHEGAGFYTYTLTAADVTTIGSKKGIGLFRESSNGENPYVYSVEIIGCRDWTTCTAPTAVAADDVTGTSATFTITDAENTLDYELYISTSSTTPTADATPTATSSSKTKTVTGLSGSTTYYYWVRSNCGGFKSDWTAGTPATFTTGTAYTVTYNGNGSTGGSVPTDATGYAEGDVVTVKTNSGSLVKSGYTFVGWSTNATPSSGTFYPAGYKFTMGAANVTLYAVWGSTGAQSINIAYFETSQHNSKSSKPDAAGKYLYGYTNSTKTIASAYTLTTSSTNNKGQGTGDSDYMRVDYGTTVNIYADTVTVSGTPAGFDDVTSVSVDFKMNNSSYYTTFDIYVGSTKIADNVSLVGDAQSSFTTFTYSGLSNLDGVVKIVNKGSGSTNYNFHIDNIVINYGSGVATGFDVTFDKNGQGSFSQTINNVPSGSKIGAPVPAPTASGYEFGGWYREAGCSNAWNFGSNTITQDTTLYAKWTTCAPTISADPSGTSYNQNADATALSVTATGEDLTYQWYSNEANSSEDGAEITGATSASYTPSTALVGTIYYYCIVTNDCGNATSAVAAITVNDSKPNPTAVWTIAEPTHGGKGFSFSVAAKKNDGSTLWDGTLTAAMLSASEDVVLSDVTVNNSTKTISGTYGVNSSATSPVSFFLELPSTATQAAAMLVQERTFTPCEDGEEGETYKVPLNAKYSSKASGRPDYYSESDYGYISPELGVSSVSIAPQEYGDEFDYYFNAGRSSVLIGTKVADVKKIQIYLNANSGSANVTKVYIAAAYSSKLSDYSELSPKSDYSISYVNANGEDSSIPKGDEGYIELEFTTSIDNGTQVYVVLKNAAKYYGAKLITTGSASGTITTSLTWSNSQASGATVAKHEDDAEFTITANRSNADAVASLGTIHYYSSDATVATVGALNGQVTIADAIDFGGETYKTTTITAVLMNSGCYKSAEINYTLRVDKNECADVAGTIEITEDNGCEGKVMTLSGYEDGASIAWYKDGSAITPEATGTTYTATESGTYTAVTTNTCARTSNSIIIEMASATAEKIVDNWYVKNGRRTPDIALVQTTDATGFTVTSGGSPLSDIGGCTFELKEDGIIYLHGTKPNGDAPSDMTSGDLTITITVTGCGGNTDPLDITIKRQAETLKPSVAFVVDGTTRAKGGTATSVSTAKTSERPLWTYLSSSFTLTGCNIYWSVDSKELREYYSQYDAIVVTDDPNTGTKGAGDVEYVKAFGTLVDVRPILTMEAYVGKYKNGGWHVYNAEPTSPNPRQVEMKLECKNHEIFAGVSEASDNVRSVTINGDDYWYITIVDTTQSPYKGTEKDYKALPALQGFNPNAFSEMLGIGTINDDKLQAGVERQQEPAARMMILGIQNNAMGALTNEGKLIIKNAISYLLKTNMEEVDDCSNYFTGATNTDWTEPTNWSKNSVPDFATKVRILAPVVIEDGQKVRASQVDIVVDGTSSKKDGELNGHVTINPGGALVVGGTVNRAIAPHYGIDDLEPTTDEDLFIQADASNNAALILDNSSGLTGATVQMYSSSYWELVGTKKKKYWSYVAVPIQEALIPDYFYGAFTYYYEEKSGWDKKWDGDYLYPFQAIGLSRDAEGTEHFWGPLVSTESRDIKLTKTATGGGENLIANSWTAPIQIANFDADDFGDANATIYIYNTGKEGAENAGFVTADTENQGAFTAGQWLGIPIGVAKLPEYTGLKVIPAMQTFEVDIPGGASNGTETTLHLDYDRLVRGVDISTDNLTEKLHAPKRRMSKNDGDVEAVMKVRVAGVHTLAEVWLIQDGAFNDGFDNGWEAYYAACDDRSPQLYAHSEMGNMGIIAKPELEGTILGFAPSRDGADYTFSFYYRGDEELYLNDLLTETSTLIDNEMTYAFTSSDKGNGSRFIISRSPYQSPQVTTGTEEVSVDGKNRAKKILYNDKIYILYNGVIYDAMGKVINRK